jgi:hypothetical protein
MVLFSGASVGLDTLRYLLRGSHLLGITYDNAIASLPNKVWQTAHCCQAIKMCVDPKSGLEGLGVRGLFLFRV